MVFEQFYKQPYIFSNRHLCFVLFGLGYLNYIPDPQYGITWVVLVLAPFAFITSILVVLAYAIYVLGNKAMRELTLYYLVFILLLKVFILAYFAVVGLSCSLGNNLCSLVPSDGVPSDPTDSLTFQFLWIWGLVEFVPLFVYAVLWANIPSYAKSSQESLILPRTIV